MLKKAYKSYLLATLVLYAVDSEAVKLRLQPKPLSYCHVKEKQKKKIVFSVLYVDLQSSKTL